VGVFVLLLIFSAGALAEDDVYGIKNNGALEDAALKAVDKLVEAKELKLGMTVAIVGVERKDIRDKKVKDILSTAIVNAKSPGTNDKRFRVVAREEAQEKVLEELKWSGSVFVDPGKAQQVGRQFGAEGLIYGDISKDGCKETLHLVLAKVEEGLQAWEVIVTGYPNKSKSRAIGWSIIPGGGQFYNHKQVKGILSVLSQAGAWIGVIIYHIDYSRKYDKYESATNIDDIEGYYDASRTAYRTRNGFFYATAAILAVSMFDACIDAYRFQRNRFSVETNRRRKVNLEIRDAQMLLAYRHTF